ncbi:hypothetical protein [Lysinibacillus fusiformis]|uniref:hypothetical protein n=1 Tax=Lysinibacillus fusiformis TaxID=28031 RepID=UPI00263A42A8|nr:hypothetical protein [Lysinibacillus fusiformis]MDC6267313.1 hypothetical protein [Lysinibacillus sphaericus]MDN4968253.1 hypothetical protein [Lysinibacillus fusiformis]MDN4968427.1 hypothetical protein [Lysinibacillus fusiformis]
MNELERIKYIKALSDNDLMHEINYQDINFLIDIAGRLEQVANEFNPTYSEGQQKHLADAYKTVIKGRS